MLSASLAKENQEISVRNVIDLLARRSLMLSTAESCTGGMIAEKITAVAGCSDVYRGGVIPYSNELKMSLLGVKAETLQMHGAVSGECAWEMVEGACRNMNTDCAIAVTGIAGPGGATEEKPVGLVFIAVKFNHLEEVEMCNFTGDRQAVREKTVAKAFALLYKQLQKQQ